MAVILGAFAVVAVLAYLKVEATVFIGFALAVLVGVGAVHQAGTKEDVKEVKQQVNGNNQRLVSAVMVALAHTPADKAPEVLAQLGLSGALPGGAPLSAPSIPSPREPVEGELVPTD
jgi:hypothetical protein